MSEGGIKDVCEFICKIKLTCYMIVPLLTLNLQHMYRLKEKIRTVKSGWATGTLSFWAQHLITCNSNV